MLLGMIIGAGLFSLPIALRDAGVPLFLGLVTVLAYFMAKVNGFYREIVDHTSDRHQLPGYVKMVLGRHWATLSASLLLFSTFGALIAYLILSGNFMSQIAPVSPFTGSMIFYGTAFVFLFFAGKSLESWDVFFTFLKMVLLVIVIAVALLSLDAPRALANVLPAKPLIAYGSVLFALTGFSIVPELKKDKGIKRSIYAAKIIASLVYLMFAFSLVMFLEGDKYVFNNAALTLLFNLAGVFSVFTPYLMLSWVAYDLFNKDLLFGKKESLLLSLAVPFFFFIIGVNDFMTVISVTGGVFLGGIVVIICRMYQKKFPGQNTLFINLIQAVFFLGVVAEILAVLY